MRPNASSAASASASLSAHSETSHRTPSALPSPPSSAARSRTRSSRRAPRTNLYPASEACLAVAAPIPLEAPVITRTGSSAIAGDCIEANREHLSRRCHNPTPVRSLWTHGSQRQTEDPAGRRTQRRSPARGGAHLHVLQRLLGGQAAVGSTARLRRLL